MPLPSLALHAGRAPPAQSFELSFDPISCAVYGASCVTRITPHSRGIDLFATLRDGDLPKFALDLRLCLVVGDLLCNIYGRVVEFCAVGNNKALLRIESDDNQSYLILCDHTDCVLPAMRWLRYVISPDKWLDLFELRPDQPPACTTGSQPCAFPTGPRTTTLYPPAPAPSFTSMLASSKEDWARRPL